MAWLLLLGSCMNKSFGTMGWMRAACRPGLARISLVRLAANRIAPQWRPMKVDERGIAGESQGLPGLLGIYRVLSVNHDWG